MSAQRAPAATIGRSMKFAWVGLFALASGFPFGVFNDLVPIWLRSTGTSLEWIGLLRVFALPWSLKLLWAPLVDRYGGRRSWISASLVFAALAMASLTLLSGAAGTLLAMALSVFTLAAATQDIAIDAYAIGILDEGEEGPANAVRVAAWRGGVLVAGGLLVALAAPLGWAPPITLGALMMLVLALAARRAPALRIEREAHQTSLWSGLMHWIRRPGAASLAAIVLLYKWPDAALGPMVRTFWVDAGLSLPQIGTLAMPITMASTILGAAAGGDFVARRGILSGLFWLGLMQALSNLAYAAAALAGGGRGVVLAAAFVENFCGGLATAAFLSLLMRVCEKKRAAVEYALLSALFASTRDLTGTISGFGVAALGYAGWFAASALFAIPGILLVFSRALAERVNEKALFRPKQC